MVFCPDLVGLKSAGYPVELSKVTVAKVPKDTCHSQVFVCWLKKSNFYGYTITKLQVTEVHVTTFRLPDSAPHWSAQREKFKCIVRSL